MTSENLSGPRRAARDQSLQDAHQQAEAQRWLPIEITQISTGQYSGRLRVLEHQDVDVYWESQNCTLHKRGILGSESCTVSFFRNKPSRSCFSEYAFADNAVFFLPAGAELDVQVAANVDTVYFRFNQSLLLKKLRAMDPSGWESSPTSLQCFEQGDRGLLSSVVDQIFPASQRHHHSGLTTHNPALSDILMEHALVALNAGRLYSDDVGSELIARRRARDSVSRVIDYTKAKLAQHTCPSISDICYDLQLSERTLQYSFNAILGLSPYTYLRYMRLNGVRAALSRPDHDQVTVTRVASHWHFLHLGRFSKDYQQMFNELPSVTLRRALQA